ncbi:hypothetical protein KP509_07G039800 [Ceratopteris richardii]|uniref:TFIIB-type domain-containing protein n=1 Tax=Ceratopteris richardii TaxID=49495 RepID=A0A8T2UG69_CERRI|nr:hypothetical protein KP509_07G039800 [Ceratopteris richardii]
MGDIAFCPICRMDTPMFYDMRCAELVCQKCAYVLEEHMVDDRLRHRSSKICVGKLENKDPYLGLINQLRETCVNVSSPSTGDEAHDATALPLSQSPPQQVVVDADLPPSNPDNRNASGSIRHVVHQEGPSSSASSEAVHAPVDNAEPLRQSNTEKAQEADAAACINGTTSSSTKPDMVTPSNMQRESVSDSLHQMKAPQEHRPEGNQPVSRPLSQLAVKISRLCALVRMSERGTRAAIAIADALEKKRLLNDRQPAMIAATVFIAATLCELPITLSEISELSCSFSSTQAMQRAHKKMKSAVDTILPPSLTNEERLTRLFQRPRNRRSNK